MGRVHPRLRTMSGGADVAVLLVTYDNEEEVAACLDAALAQASADIEPEVVVVDNASTDGTRSLLAGYGDSIEVIAHRENVGYAEGVNTAFAASSSEWVLLLNPDVEMDPGCVAALLAHLRANPRSAVAAALLRDPGGGLQRFARREMDLRSIAWGFTEIGRLIDERRGGRKLRWRRYEAEWRAGVNEPLAVDCPAAACVLTRRALLEPRPFDPDLPLFFNDSDLWRRLRRQGLSLDVVPDATASHGYGTTVRRVDPARLRAEWVVSMRRYMAGQVGPLGRAALYLMLLGSALAAGVIHLAGGRRSGLGAEVRGTLGGLGLPGGAEPWLTRDRLGPRASG